MVVDQITANCHRFLLQSFGDENIVVYLDNGEVHVPDHAEIYKSDDYYYNSLHQRLRDVMFTTTSQEDLSIPNEERIEVDDFILVSEQGSTLEMLPKQ